MHGDVRVLGSIELIFKYKVLPSSGNGRRSPAVILHYDTRSVVELSNKPNSRSRSTARYRRYARTHCLVYTHPYSIGRCLCTVVLFLR